MSSNSQFQLLKAQVKAQAEEIQRLQQAQGSDADVAAQKELLKQSRQQQAIAKQVLLDPQSSAKELEAVAPFLPTSGLQEQARLDARSKRANEQMLQPQVFLERTDLIDGMKAAYSRGDYQNKRDAMRQSGNTSFTDGRKTPPSKKRPTEAAMKAARTLAERTFLKEKSAYQPLAEFKRKEDKQENKTIPLSRFFDI